MSPQDPNDAVARFPCPECAELVPVEARLCHHCQTSTLVDVILHGPVADPRVRYQVTRALQALPSAPSLSAIQAGLLAKEPTAGRGVTRAFAYEALTILTEHGVKAVLRRPTPSGSSRHLAGAAVYGLLALVVLAAGVVLAWRQLVPRPDSAPASAGASAPILSARELAQRSLPSTVSLRCKGSVGSGFFVAKDLVLTNAHVLCPPGETIEVVLSDGRKTVGVRERACEAVDLGLVRVPGANAKPLPLGDVADLAAGDKLMIIGSPIGLEFTVHEGSVSSTSRSYRGLAYVQLDAKINPGNSGGPAIDTRGRVIGVVTRKAMGAEGIGLALPINYAYAREQSLVAPPSPAAAASAAFQKMVARAREEGAKDAQSASAGAAPSDGSSSSLGEIDLRAGSLLASVSTDEYQRMVVRLLRVQELPPRYEEIEVGVWKGTEKFCTIKGDVSNWKILDPDRAGAGVSVEMLRALRQSGAGRIYIGESPLRWDLCNDALMNGWVEIELVNGNPASNRIKAEVVWRQPSRRY